MYNKVILIGRLTAKPEVNQTASGKHVTRITVAVNRRFKTENGDREADFITAVFWGKLAETLASYGGKGSLISIDGELRTRKYEKKWSKSIRDRSSWSVFSIARKPCPTCHAREYHRRRLGRFGLRR